MDKGIVDSAGKIISKRPRSERKTGRPDADEMSDAVTILMTETKGEVMKLRLDVLRELCASTVKNIQAQSSDKLTKDQLWDILHEYVCPSLQIHFRRFNIADISGSV